jgi:pimeloyl-ACP methyl ester carboxylesterase
MTAVYRPRRTPGERDFAIRGLRYHVTTWPGAESPPAVMLHGFLDTGATFQFLVDELDDRLSFAAPDWRGFGATSWAPDGYWFPDYFADLDALLDELSPGVPATLIGHSMGGNIALQYAGLRQERVRRVVCIEGFGLPRTNAAQAPERLRRWLDELREPPQYSPFASYDAFASFLATRNPRLSPERAQFVARAWGRVDPDGRVGLRADPAHKRVNPVLYRREEAEAAWSDISAPVLYVVGGASEHLTRLGFDGQVERVKQFIRRLEPCVIADAAHMVHHDRPAELAAAIESFLLRT